MNRECRSTGADLKHRTTRGRRDPPESLPQPHNADVNRLNERLRTLEANRVGPGAAVGATSPTVVSPYPGTGYWYDGGGPYVTATIGASGQARIDVCSGQVILPVSGPPKRRSPSTSSQRPS